MFTNIKLITNLNTYMYTCTYIRKLKSVKHNKISIRHVY